MSRPFQSAASLGALPFVGRETELRELSGAYQESYNGARVIALVFGEMGCGKSRLLGEFFRRQELKKAFVIRMRLGEPGKIRGLSALREALIESLEPRPSLRRQVDVFLSAAGDAEMGAVLARALDLIGQRVPLVLLVDDLESAGREFSMTLGRLLAQVESSFLFVCTGNPSFQETAAEMCEAAEVDPVAITLEPLSADALADLVSTMLGVRPDSEGSAWLLSITRGLPILVRFAVHALMRQGCIAMREGKWVIAHPFKRCNYTIVEALPSLRSRLEELPQGDRAAITRAALLGRRLPHALLERFDFPATWYLPLVARDFLAVRGRFVEFSHNLQYEAALGEAIDRRLVDSMRCELLALLRETAVSDTGLRLPQATVRAFLARESEPDGEEARAFFDAVLNAASVLFAQDDYVSAAGHFRECRSYWSEIRQLYSPLEIARWTNWYAQSLFRIGDVAEQRRLLEEFLIPFEAAPPSGELVAEVADAMLGLVECLYREKQIDRALAMLDNVRALLLTADRRNPRIQSAFIAVAMRRAQLLATVDRLDEAAAIYRSILAQTDDSVYSAPACQALTFLGDYTGDEKIMERIKAMLAICEREGRRRDAALLRAHIVMSTCLDGGYDGAEAQLHAMIKETHQFLLPRTESNGWYFLSLIQSDRGDFVEALRLIERAVEIRFGTRSLAMWQVAVIMKIRYLTLLGRHDDAIATIEMLERDAAENGRTHRRFLIEASRRMIAVRRGGWRAEQARLDELRQIGIAEAHQNAEEVVFELEGEILIHMTRPKLSAVAAYASGIEKFEPKGAYWPILWIRAAAALGRAMGSVVGDKRPAKSYAVFETVMTKAREALQDWERKGFVHNLANAVKLLRVHASGLFDEQELAERLAGGVAPPSFHECSVISFGRLRVVDLSGTEKGGRHFGTHKSDSKPRKMLAALVAGAVQDRRLTRERLVDMIWGDHVAGDTAANNFHVTLSGLRQVIGDSVDFDGTTYALNEQCVRVDAIEFVRLLAEATDHERAGRMFRAFDLLGGACALYTGEFLEGIFDEWSDGARDLLRAKARGAHLRLAEIAVQRGEFDIARQTVQRLLDHDSADEEAIYLHLSILNAEGDRVRALREYDRFATLLQNEYGVHPSRRLRDLRDLIAAD